MVTASVMILVLCHHILKGCKILENGFYKIKCFGHQYIETGVVVRSANICVVSLTCCRPLCVYILNEVVTSFNSQSINKCIQSITARLMLIMKVAV